MTAMARLLMTPTILLVIVVSQLAATQFRLGSRRLTTRFADTDEQYQAARQTLGDHGVLSIRSRQRLDRLVDRLAPLGLKIQKREWLSDVDFDHEMIVLVYKCGDQRIEFSHEKPTMKDKKLDVFMSYVVIDKQPARVEKRCQLIMIPVPKVDRMAVSVNSYHPQSGGKHPTKRTAKVEWTGVVGVQAGDIVGNLQAEIKADSPTVLAGDDILIRFTLLNAGAAKVENGQFASAAKSAHVWDGKYSGGYRNHAFLVRTPDGKTHFLRRALQLEWDKNIPHPVSVTEDRSYTLPEWREGEFLKSFKRLGLDTAPSGTYTITGLYQQQSMSGDALAKRFDRWDGIEMWGGIIASNTITVQVEKAKPAELPATVAIERIKKLELQHTDGDARPAGAALSFSRDGRTLASASAHDGTVRLWDLPSEKEICQVNAASGDSDTPSLYPVAFSPDGRTFATGGKRIVQWSLMGVRLRTFDDDDAPTYALAFSPDGKTLASCENQSLVTLWDVATAARRQVKCPHDIFAVSYSNQGDLLVLTESGVLRELTSGRTLGRVSWAVIDRGIPYSDDGGISVQPSKAGEHVNFRLVSTATSKQLRQFKGHRGPMNRILSLAVTRDGRRFAISDLEGRILVWLVTAPDASGQGA